MRVRIFVFGTLKQDYPNYRFNSGRRLVGCFVTMEKYPLYLVGPRHSPWMVNAPGAGFEVNGELFEVDSAGLKAMDELERIDQPDGYRRLTVAVQNRDSGEVEDVFIYLKPQQQYLEALHTDNVRSGPWDCYTVEHSLLYRSRNRTDQGSK
jgi:gamma-glutamylaminecyclotransferase